MDFSKCEVDLSKAYDGKNGAKMAVFIDDEVYMLKFPPVNKVAGHEMSYRNDSISEYLGCHIFESVGIPAQDTVLGTYPGRNGELKIVVACRDLTEPDKKLIDFAALKNTIVDSENNGYGTDLSDILLTIKEQDRVNPVLLENRFWDMFVADALIGNPDRHNGNWGFLVDNHTKEWELAPVFDCGSSLLAASSQRQKQMLLDDRKEMDIRIYERPMTPIQENGVRINMYNFFRNCKNPMFKKAVKRIVPRVNMEKIGKIIDDMPYITDLDKKFYKAYIGLRQEIILEPALKRVLQEERKKSLAKNKVSNHDFGR